MTAAKPTKRKVGFKPSMRYPKLNYIYKFRY